MALLDPVTLDQLRVYLAVIDAGSFSGAARRLGRAQSAVSHAVANLEGQLRVRLFERDGRGPVLTDAGRALVADARKLALDMDRFRARARGLAAGLEPELALVVDVMVPMPRVVEALRSFEAAFPSVPTRLYVEALGAVARLVADGTCALGVVASLPELPPTIVGEAALGAVELVPVAAPSHPLAAASAAGPVPDEEVQEHLQLVLTDRTALIAGREFGVLARRTWRLADLGAKHALLLAGLGWGNMPAHVVADDLAEGRLRRLSLAALGDSPSVLPLHLARRRDGALGPAARWLAAHLLGAPPSGGDDAPAPPRR